VEELRTPIAFPPALLIRGLAYLKSLEASKEVAVIARLLWLLMVVTLIQRHMLKSIFWKNGLIVCFIKDLSVSTTNMHFSLDLSTLSGAGLCNQLYAVLNACLEAGVGSVVCVSGFRPDMFEASTCPLSVVVNIQATNHRLAREGLATVSLSRLDGSRKLDAHPMPMPSVPHQRCIVPCREAMACARSAAPRSPYNAIHIRLDIDFLAAYCNDKGKTLYARFVNSESYEESQAVAQEIMSLHSTQRLCEDVLNKASNIISMLPASVPLYVCTPVKRDRRHRLVECYLDELKQKFPHLLIKNSPLHPKREIAAMVEACIGMGAREFAGAPGSTLSAFISARRSDDGSPVLPRYRNETTGLKFLLCSFK
jgi:hypothetical protein